MTLTEQWKKGELEDYKTYYVRLDNGCIERLEYIKKHNGFGYAETDWVVEVLAPVPSYEELRSTGKFAIEAMKVAEENQRLKELLKECRTMLGQLGAEVGTFDVVETMLKIDNAIGEKK